MAHKSIALLCCAFSLGSAQAAGILVLQSEAGDFIGQGQNLIKNFNDEDVVISSDARSLSVTGFGEPFWLLQAASPSGADLRAACYERAQRLPPATQFRPHFDFSLDSRGCNDSSSRFRILDLGRDPATGDITNLAVDFVQHCSNFGPATFGKLRYNSTVPVDGEGLAPVWDTSGFLRLAHAAPDVIDSGNDRTISFDRTSLFHPSYQEPERMYSVASFRYGFYGLPLVDSWKLDFAAPDQMPLVAGHYAGAERYPFQSSGHAGLSFEYSTCFPLDGAFDVFEFEREPIDHLPSFLMASFSQRCENSTPTFDGDIALSTTFRSGPFVPDVIHLDGMDGTPQWPLVWDCD